MVSIRVVRLLYIAYTLDGPHKAHKLVGLQIVQHGKIWTLHVSPSFGQPILEDLSCIFRIFFTLLATATSAHRRRVSGLPPAIRPAPPSPSCSMLSIHHRRHHSRRWKWLLSSRFPPSPPPLKPFFDANKPLPTD